MVSEIEASIAEYKDLDAIAQCHSLEITELGWVTSGQLKEEIGDIVFDLEAGGLSPVLNSDGRFYIFEVKAIRPSGTQPLFDVQEEVSHLLFSRKMQEAMVEWLEELRSEAYIEIKEVESSR
jgi:peptidyl-prolyl cis-trans isomerase SurA